jgi:hypothetical protein
MCHPLHLRSNQSGSEHETSNPVAVGGQVVAVPFREGQHVAAGDVLMLAKGAFLVFYRVTDHFQVVYIRRAEREPLDDNAEAPKT